MSAQRRSRSIGADEHGGAHHGGVDERAARFHQGRLRPRRPRDRDQPKATEHGQRQRRRHLPAGEGASRPDHDCRDEREQTHKSGGTPAVDRVPPTLQCKPPTRRQRHQRRHRSKRVVLAKHSDTLRHRDTSRNWSRLARQGVRDVSSHVRMRGSRYWTHRRRHVVRRPTGQPEDEAASMRSGLVCTSGFGATGLRYFAA